MQKSVMEIFQKSSKSLSFGKATGISRPGDSLGKKVTLIRGAGIGPEITRSVEEIFESLQVPVTFERLQNFKAIDEKTFDQLVKNEHVFMGPIKKVDKYNINQTKMYKHLGLFAQVIPIISIPGVDGVRHTGVNTVIIRENTEGEYSGIEHEVYPGVIESIKVTTKAASLKTAEYGFEFAFLSGRKKVTAVHKANIMKICDGLFLEACREVAAKYPNIKYEEMIVDNCSMQLVKTPQQFDVMLMPNLYGTIVTNIAMGVTGNIGTTPGVMVGDNMSIYGQGTRHRGFDIAGQDIVNPTGAILSSVCMLRHMNLHVFADAIMNGTLATIQQKQVTTRDIGGTASTSQFVQEIIKNSRLHL